MSLQSSKSISPSGPFDTLKSISQPGTAQGSQSNPQPIQTILVDKTTLLNRPFKYSDNDLTTFQDYLNLIFKSLGLSNQVISEINDEFTELLANDIEILKSGTNTPDFITKINALIKADENLKEISKTIGQDYQTILPQWNSLLTNLAKLQGYIILNKVKSNDCSGLIKAIIDAMDAKIKATNEILEFKLKEEANLPSSRLPSSSSSLSSQNKYFKYKNKYLNLKKLNF